jgi:hypothetical protein
MTPASQKSRREAGPTPLAGSSSKQDRRTMDQRTAQRQTLTPPAGEVGRERLLPRMQAGPDDELVAPLPQAPAPHTVHAAIELEVLRRRQIAVEPEPL